MGCHTDINFDTFPKQGNHLGKKVKVCFHFDTSRLISGEIVRNDTSDPYLTIIKLEDGRHVLGTECQYSVS